MRATGADGERSATCAERNCCEIYAHLVRIVPNIILISVAKFSVATVAPTLDRRIVQHRTRMRETCTDCASSAPRTHVDNRKRVAHLICTITQIVGCTRTQPTIAARTPTLDGGVVENGACVCISCTQCECSATSTQVDCRCCSNSCRTRVTNVGDCALTKLTRVTTTPTDHRRVVEQRTGVV